MARRPASRCDNALPYTPALYKNTITWGIPTLLLIVLGLGNRVDFWGRAGVGEATVAGTGAA